MFGTDLYDRVATAAMLAMAGIVWIFWFWFFIAKRAIWRLWKAEAKYFIICKDNVVQNFVLKFSQFGIKCSTERKRINLFLMIVSEYLSDVFVGLSERCFLLEKESYICLEVASQIGKEPQFSLMCAVWGMGLIQLPKSLPQKNMKFDRRQTTTTCLR